MRFQHFERAVLALAVFLPSACLFSQTSPTFKFSAPHIAPLGSNFASTYPGINYEGVEDINGDGNTDILTFAFTSSGSQIGLMLLGDGKGNFTPSPGTTPLQISQTGPVIGQPVVADVNGDGVLDIINVNGGPRNPVTGCLDAGALQLFLGDKHGNFSGGTIGQISPASNWSIATGDFNRDGKRDIAVLSFSTVATPGAASCLAQFSTLDIFLNNGDGTFRHSYSKSIQYANTSYFTNWLVAGDFNGDGNPDLTFLETEVNGSGAENMITLYGNGDGTFRDGSTYTLDKPANWLTVADLNGDKKDDIVAQVDANQGGSPRFPTLLAKQLGGFYWKSAVSTANPAIVLVELGPLVDLNHDGKLDLMWEWVDSSSPQGYHTVVNGGLGGGVFGTRQIVAVQTAYSFTTATPLVKGGKPALISFPLRLNMTPGLSVQFNLN